MQGCTTHMQPCSLQKIVCTLQPSCQLMNGMSDVWKIQYVGWGRVINIAQGKAVCCIYYDTPP